MWRLICWRRLTVALLVWITSSLPTDAEGQPSSDPRATIERSIKALGGRDKLKTLERCYVRSEVRIRAGASVEWQTWQDTPNRNKQVVLFADNGKKLELTVILDGRKGWKTIRDLDAQTSETHPHEVTMDESISHEPLVRRLYPLLDKTEYELAFVGEANKGKRVFQCVRAVTKKKIELDIYFDKETGLVEWTVSKARDPSKAGGKLIEQYFEGYKDYDGLKYATKHKSTIDGSAFMESNILELRLVERFLDGTFAPPTMRPKE